MDDRAYTVAGNVPDPKVIHQLIISGSDLNSIHLCNDAVSADFPDI